MKSARELKRKPKEIRACVPEKLEWKQPYVFADDSTLCFPVVPVTIKCRYDIAKEILTTLSDDSCELGCKTRNQIRTKRCLDCKLIRIMDFLDKQFPMVMTDRRVSFYTPESPSNAYYESPNGN